MNPTTIVRSPATRPVLRLLLVEDSPDDEALVRLTLSEAGHVLALRRVSSRQALQNSLSESLWDLILCDHNLPNLDSLEALQIVNESGVRTPFVILSGSIPDQQAIEAMRRGARDFIHKDTLGKLVPVIERELATVAMSDALLRLNDNLQRLSDFDRLTGLPNREHLLRYLNQRVQRQAPDGERCTLLLLDVNRFRQIGRTLGAPVADQVIAAVARTITATAGSANFAARIGGDSFALLVNHTADESADKAQAMAERIAHRLTQPIRVEHHELFVSLSIGACSFPDGAERGDQLFVHAEAALYQAKQTGGGSYRLFQPAMIGLGVKEIILESALHRALKNREFVLYYQPQLDLASGRLVSVEALLRWRHHEWGLVSPGEFIPLLEETGLIVPVGEWIIDSACAQLHAWRAAGHALPRMAVNLSPLQFDDGRLVDVVAAALHQYALEPQCLELEITESIVMQGREQAIQALQALRELGVRIAVDDFGTGYSSLGYLKRFPITTLKIDQMFIRECVDNAQDRALVETMIAMGHRLGLEVVAEGVETQAQAALLIEYGCQIGQGYLFGKPQPPDELARRLTSVAQ